MDIKTREDVERYQALHEYEKKCGIGRWNQTRIVTCNEDSPMLYEVRCLTLWEKIQAFLGRGKASKESILNPSSKGHDLDKAGDYSTLSLAVQSVVDRELGLLGKTSKEALLETAILAGNVNTVKALIKDGVDVNKTVKGGPNNELSLLAVARNSKNAAVIKVLEEALKGKKSSQ